MQASRLAILLRPPNACINCRREVVGAHAVDGLRSLVFDLTSRREQIETAMGNVKTPQYINAQTGPITQSHNAL